MKYLEVKVFWNKNKDYRVTELIAKLYIIGQDEIIGEISLPPDADHVILSLQDNTSYNLNISSLTEDDMITESSFTFHIPDLTNPMSLSGFNWEIIKIIDEAELIAAVNDAEEQNEKEDEEMTQTAIN